MYYKSLFWAFVVPVIFLFSCTGGQSPVVRNEQEELKQAPDPVFEDSVPAKLTLPDYYLWLRNNRTTCVQRENEAVKVSLLYKPEIIEAALSVSGDLTEERIRQQQTAKTGYHYLAFEYLNKSLSLNKKTGFTRNELMQVLTEHTRCVVNSSDTLFPIVEVFSSGLVQVPDKAILLVPKSPDNESLEVTIPGSFFGTRDLKLKISESQLKSFPELKI